ncbi:MAG: hypothetical protein HKN91_08490 [Acidimicrobiia bacterium]|nr:hypothetical protein [Acidimicrobiia bacterium]
MRTTRCPQLSVFVGRAGIAGADAVVSCGVRMQSDQHGAVASLAPGVRVRRK